MKGFILLLIMVLNLNVRAQIPNHSMELWNAAPQLSGWQTNSFPLTLPPWDPYIIRKDTNSYSGTYCANFWGNGFIKPLATTTFALGTSRPTHLDFWYTLQFAPCVNDVEHWEKDTVSVLIELLNNGAVVDNGYWESLVNQIEYAKQSIPISHFNADFDSCRITIIGGSVYGGCGVIAAATEFRVDELTLVFPLDCIDTSLINEETFCLAVFEPVCGCNGVTYVNKCEAKNFGGLIDWTNGPCGNQNAGDCLANFDFERDNYTVNFNNTSTAATIVENNWDFGDGNSSLELHPEHTYATTGWYVTCLSITGFDSTGISCTDKFCDSIYISDGCIDSSLICPPWSLCCDAPLEEPVCGCDGVTYMNACVASSWGGVLHYTEGECNPTGVKEERLLQSQIMPNPVSNTLHIRLKVLKPTALVGVVTNLMGSEIMRKTIQISGRGESQMDFNVQHLAKGMYLLELRIDGQPVKTESWIKQ